jgi:hypothetical protein
MASKICVESLQETLHPPHSAWKSSPKTGKRLRLDWTKTGKKKLEKTRLDKTEDWKRLHKDRSLWLRPV